MTIEHISKELAMIYNLRNTAVNHKKYCAHNCNVSLYHLKDTAEYLRDRLTSHKETTEADKLIGEMPII